MVTGRQKRTRWIAGAILVLTIGPLLGCSGSTGPGGGDGIAEPDTLTAAPEGSFSLVILPDTQDYVDGSNDTLTRQMQWIVDNLESQRIVFVSHVGDLVLNNTHAEWNLIRQAMDILHGQVPYGVSVGNHDMESDGGTSMFESRFGDQRFAGFDWYGGDLGNNTSSFQLFTAAGLDFLFLHLPCNAPDGALTWAGEVLSSYAERIALVTTHMYLGPVAEPPATGSLGRMQWKKCFGDAGNTPEQMWNECFSRYANIAFIFCGDQREIETLHQVSTGLHGNQVRELLSDYRDGYLRLVRFLPEEDRVEVYTYSPVLGHLCPGTVTVPQRGAHQFSLPFAMSD